MAKNFKDLDLDLNNTTATLLSEGEKKPVEKKKAKAKKEAPAVEDFKPTVKETKSKKLLILLKPSTYERISANASKYKLSVNEYINQVLDNIK